MSDATSTELTTQADWIAIVARNCGQEQIRINRGTYLRSHDRSNVACGRAKVEFGPDPETRIVRAPQHLSILQISPEGLMLRGRDDLPGGLAVSLSADIGEDVATLRGFVRHTTMTVGGYKLGIELQF